MGNSIFVGSDQPVNSLQPSASRVPMRLQRSNDGCCGFTDRLPGYLAVPTALRDRNVTEQDWRQLKLAIDALLVQRNPYLVHFIFFQAFWLIITVIVGALTGAIGGSVLFIVGVLIACAQFGYIAKRNRSNTLELSMLLESLGGAVFAGRQPVIRLALELYAVAGNTRWRHFMVVFLL